MKTEEYKLRRLQKHFIVTCEDEDSFALSVATYLANGFEVFGNFFLSECGSYSVMMAKFLD